VSFVQSLIYLIGELIGEMGYLGYFYVENKSFEFRSNVQGGVQLAEKSRGKTREVIMAWPTIFWLVSAWDYLSNSETVRENWRTFRFGWLSYVMQRRKNSNGNFLELSEYGGKGRRSFVIIPEGNEGKGWNDCRSQLQRLKMHYEKNREGVSTEEDSEGRKQKKQPCGETKETQLVGHSDRRSYAAAVVRGKITAGDFTQATSEGGTIPSKEGANVKERLGGDHVQHKMEGAFRANIMERLGGDHVLQQMEILTRNNQEITLIKDILISLQKDVASCLQRLEMGWGKNGYDIQMGSDKGVQGLTDRASKGEKADGPVQPKQMVEIKEPVDKPTRIQLINRYKRIYVRRNQRRRWCPKAVGRMDQPVIAETPESDRSVTPEKAKEVSRTEQTDEKGGQVRDGCRMVEETSTGGMEVTGELPMSRRDSQMELVSGSWGDEIADQHKRVIRSDTKEEEPPKGCASLPIVGGQKETSRSGLSSSNFCSAMLVDADKSCGSDRLENSDMGKQILGSFTSQASCQSCGPAVSCDLNYAEVVEPTGLERKSCDEVIPREDAVVGDLKLQEEPIIAGEEDSRLVIVPINQTEVEQPDFYITEEVMKMGTGAYTICEGGSSNVSLINVEGDNFIDVPLEIEPLEAYPNCPEGKVCEWVIERVKGMCHVWGMSCEGYEGELEKLFRKIESNRGKAISPAATPSKSTLRGNRELRGLQWNMNSEGKLGEEKRGKNQKQRARGGGCIVIK
jgi:hypothetical protein